MGWNRALPAGTTAVASSDNAIRDNWDFLRSAIAQEHVDPDAFPSTPSQIVHSLGSGRTFVYTGATVLSSSAAVVAAVSLYHDSRDIGRVVVDKNSTATPGAVWYCTATDVFVERTQMWSNGLAAGTLGITGLLTASGGVTIPTTKLLTGPTGESWLVNGAQTMNPLLHAARHAAGGQDVITGLVAGNMIYKSSAGPITAAGTLVTYTFDFSGRSGNTLLAVLGWVQLHIGAGTDGVSFTAAIQLNDVDKSQVLAIAQQDGSDETYGDQVGPIPCAFTVPNSAAQKIDLEMKTFSRIGASSDVRNFGMLILDLGAVGLTT